MVNHAAQDFLIGTVETVDHGATLPKRVVDRVSGLKN
jgi:hypothetical protein